MKRITSWNGDCVRINGHSFFHDENYMRVVISDEAAV